MEGEEQKPGATETPEKAALVSKELVAELEKDQEELRLYRKIHAEQRTTYTVSRTENPDSIEIGTQKDGRIKVYGDASRKAEFAAKVKDLIEITAAAKESMTKAGLLPAANGKPAE